VTPWPVEITTDSTVSCGALLWRFQRRLMLTVVVKASFSLTPGGIVVPVSPPEILREDRLLPTSPTEMIEEDCTYFLHPLRSVVAASDLAPYLARCDVTLTGHAHASSGCPSLARLAIFRDAQQSLLDKTLHIYGDREGHGAPLCFTRMPL